MGPALGGGARDWRVRLGVGLGVALAYFGAAKLGLGLAFETANVTAIWPPAGIALAALVLGGPRLWPGVALGAFLANVTTDVPLYTTLGITAGNTLEAIAGAWLLRRAGFRPRMPRVADALMLVFLAGVLSTTIAATIGVASLAAGDQFSDEALSVWRVWWLGDMGGILLVAPFLMVLATHWPFRELPGRAVEGAAMLASMAGVGLLVFGGMSDTVFLLFPFLIWAALRFWQPGATTAALAVAVIAVAYTAVGSGPFVEPSEDESLLLAQLFAGVAGLTALVLAILSSERTRIQRETEEIAHTLQIALLPPRLPAIPQLETAAWHRPGARGQEIGGDFYDLFQTGPSEWDGVIGDVCGKGPAAASLTGLARHTLRAVAEQSRLPSEALRRLNQAVIDQGEGPSFLTASYARLATSREGHLVTIANAGHPPPIVVRGEGELEDAGGAGMLLGVFAEPVLEDHQIALVPGDALVFFTDGLVELGEAGDGFAWLREVLRDCAGGSAAAIADRVRRDASPRAERLDDDQAVLVLCSVAGEGGQGSTTLRGSGFSSGGAWL
ncbi:MAG TPA: MASE1 domain-containing protein [Solirubrobacterales bacterium]